MSEAKQTHVFKEAEGCTLRADVYRPAGDGPHPVIVWMHGGALITGHRAGVSSREVPLYCGADYAMVSIDYRLAPTTKLAETIEDVRDAFAWVRAEGPDLFAADPDRLVAMGSSAGGYLTLMAGFCVEPRPRALVAVAGYGDIVGDWYSRPDPFYRRQPLIEEQAARAAVGAEPTVGTPDRQGQRGSFYLWCRQNGRWPIEVAGHDPDREPEAFRPFCPVQNVTRQYAPTFLIHGNRDTDVPYEQSVMMARALAAAGVDHEFVTIEGGGHCSMGGSEAEVKATYARVLAFLKRHVGRRRVDSC